MLLAIKAFLEKPDNNRYDTPVRVLQPGWDLTPLEPAPIQKLDHFLQCGEIKKVLHAIFNNVDHTWAAHNRENALCFFTPGRIPFQASQGRGASSLARIPTEKTDSVKYWIVFYARSKLKLKDRS